MSGEEGGWFYGDSGDPVIRFGMMDRTGGPMLNGPAE